ncbi:MAG TPA: PA0069 family radical SAM protein [Rubricoccaceae bacterium]|nr:PA0069 family radical SAM protein [Rubricoccaceae bacterium]
MDESTPLPRRGRGAAENPPNRFEPLHLEEDPEALDEDERRQAPTQLFRDTPRTILARNDSPDIPFRWSLNPYRGCEHGCIYCYARPSHEYLGFSAGLDFETKIVVKPEAPRLLEETFRKRSWEPAVVALSGNTDCYQPIERRLQITRGCLEVFARYRNPVSLITKNSLVLRDLDLLQALAAHDAVHVTLSLTTLRDAVAGVMEPRASRPGRRLFAVEQLAKAGVPVGILIAPLIPGLTDEELPAILEAAAERGAMWAGYMVVRLPGPVEALFEAWLRRSFPDRAAVVLSRLREARGGHPNEARFGHRMRAQGPWKDVLDGLFRAACARHGLNQRTHRLSTAHFRRPGGQLSLF